MLVTMQVSVLPYLLITNYQPRSKKPYRRIQLLLMVLLTYLPCAAHEEWRDVSSGFMEILLPPGYSERGDCHEKTQELKTYNGIRKAKLEQSCFQKGNAFSGNSIIMCLKLSTSDSDPIPVNEAKDWVDRHIAVNKMLWTGDNSCSRGISIGKSNAVVDAKWIKVIDHRYAFIKVIGKSVQILIVTFVKPSDLNTSALAEKVFEGWKPK